MDALTRSLRASRFQNLVQKELFRSEAGSTTLEFAVAVPVVVLLVFGSIAIMLGLLSFANANYATGFRALYAGLHSSTSDAPASRESIADQVRSHLWLSIEDPEVTTAWSAGNTPGSQVTVTTAIALPLSIPLTTVRQLTITTSAVRVVTR